MNRYIIVFACLILILSGLSYGQRLNIAVLDLDPTGISKPDAQFLSDRLRTELFETGIFQVIEREKMEAILKEQGFQNAGCTSVECAVEIGELLNVKSIVAGSIGKIEDLYSITLRMIDVKTGAIERTATEDHEGSLSDVLTEVIPVVAANLAQYSVMTQDEDVAVEILTQSPYRILMKYGIAILTYTGEQNKAVTEYRETFGGELESFSNHSLFSLEGQYTLDPDWQLKLGIIIENMYFPWTASYPVYEVKYTDVNLERSYSFTSWYIGANYTFWCPRENYRWYVGYDMGSTTMDSRVKQAYKVTVPNETSIEEEKTYTYIKFTLKLDIGIEYMLSKHFVIGAEIGTQIISDFDTSGEEIPPGFPENFLDIMYPSKIVASGLRIAGFVGYNF